jgi:hypothetical protein
MILASTSARSSNALLGWNCGYTFCRNVLYGVIFAFTPELFPAKCRGTGSALTVTANRICGVMVRAPSSSYNFSNSFLQAPVIALYANLTTSTPIYISGALFLIAGSLVLLLPYESRDSIVL